MLKFTQGDTPTLNLTAQTDSGDPVDLTGATFTTYLKGKVGAVVAIPNASHTANPDQVNFKGQFTVAITAVESAACLEGTNKEVVTKITIGADIVFYRAQILTVLTPNPLQ